jgi:hypothetical protein
MKGVTAVTRRDSGQVKGNATQMVMMMKEKKKRKRDHRRRRKGRGLCEENKGNRRKALRVIKLRNLLTGGVNGE